MEDPPDAYVDHNTGAIAKKRSRKPTRVTSKKAAATDVLATPRSRVSDAPFGWHHVKVARASVAVEANKGNVLSVGFVITEAPNEGREFVHHITLSPPSSERRTGQTCVKQLCYAVGAHPTEVKNEDQLVGRELRLFADQWGTITKYEYPRPWQRELTAQRVTTSCYRFLRRNEGHAGPQTRAS